jgi:hypothetical protein
VSDEVTRQAAEAQAERNVTREHYDWMVFDRDTWKQQAEALKGAAQRMTVEIQSLTAERDAARADLAIVRVKRNEAQEERDAALAEIEGLRADLLAHPPETHTELAAERQRHIELMEDYDRREVVITTLEDALKRAENAMKTAQAQHIDERLKGFLAVISQLADQAQDLIP